MTYCQGCGYDHPMTTTPTTLTLAAFLTARLDEREAAARAAQAISDGPWLPDKVYDDVRAMDLAVRSAAYGVGRDVRLPYESATHIALNDPAYVLADVASKRAIVAFHRPSTDHGPDYDPYCVGCWHEGGEDGAPSYPCQTTRLLAAPFREHPEFDMAWVVS